MLTCSFLLEAESGKTSFTISFTELVGGASSSAKFCLGRSLSRKISSLHHTAEMQTHLELSNIEFMPKSDAVEPDRRVFIFALTGTNGASSCRWPLCDKFWNDDPLRADENL